MLSFCFCFDQNIVCIAFPSVIWLALYCWLSFVLLFYLVIEFFVAASADLSPDDDNVDIVCSTDIDAANGKTSPCDILGIWSQTKRY